MNLEDIIYVLLLCFSMCFGSYYRRIQNAEVKKIVGTLVGFFLVVVVSGIHTIHLLLTTFINSCLILYGDKG